MRDINEIMKMCDNALDLGDTENVNDLLELLRAMLEPVANFIEHTNYDGYSICRQHERNQAIVEFTNILDIVEDF